MNPHVQIHEDAGPDWDRLSAALKRWNDEPVTEFDVARLRRRVREGLGSTRPRSIAFRLAASAAAFVVGAVTLVAVLRHGEPAGTQQIAGTNAAAPIALARAKDGSVLFKFQDGRSTHRIAKSDDPQSAGDEVRIAKGRKFVDRSEHPRPGEVVFYRID